MQFPNSVLGGWKEVTVCELPADSHNILGKKTTTFKATAPPADTDTKESPAVKPLQVRVYNKCLLVFLGLYTHAHTAKEYKENDKQH